MSEEQPFEIPPEILHQVPLFAELAKVLSWRGGPVNWDLARQVASALAAQGRPATGTVAGRDEAAEALRLADLWLAEATGLPAPASLPAVRATTAVEWAAHSCEAFREIVDPIARRVAAATASMPAAEEGQEAALAGALRQMVPLVLGIQAGVVLGTLARDAFGAYDVPIPPPREGSVALVLPTVDAFADAYGLDRREARLWAALHEAAHRLEMESLPWVGAHFYALYHNYVAATEFDLTGLMERLEGLDPTNPAALEETLGDRGLFGMAPSPAAQEALAKVEAFLALLEAYADRAAAAAAERLSSPERIAEAVARRRAEPGRGESLLRRFIGVDLRGEHVRRAAPFVDAVARSGGFALLNRMWEEPDGLPGPEEIADPEAWVARIRRTRP